MFVASWPACFWFCVYLYTFTFGFTLHDHSCSHSHLRFFVSSQDMTFKVLVRNMFWDLLLSLLYIFSKMKPQTISKPVAFSARVLAIRLIFASCLRVNLQSTRPVC